MKWTTCLICLFIGLSVYPAALYAQEVKILDLSHTEEYIVIEVQVKNGLTYADFNRFSKLLQQSSAELKIELTLERKVLLSYTNVSYQIGAVSLEEFTITRSIILEDPIWTLKWKSQEKLNFAEDRNPKRFQYYKDNDKKNFEKLNQQFFNLPFHFYIPKKYLDIQSSDRIYCKARASYQGGEGGWFGQVNFRTNAVWSANAIKID